MATSDRFDTQRDLSQADMEQQLHEALASLRETQRELNKICGVFTGLSTHIQMSEDYSVTTEM